MILSEGETDTQFLEALIDNYHNGWDIDVLDIDSTDQESRIPRETNKIRQFNQRFNPDDILLKSEGGKPNLVQTMPIIIKRYTKSELLFDFLIDLDLGSINDVVDSINDSLSGNSGGKNIQVRGMDSPRQRTYMATQCLEVVSEGNRVGTFNLIGLDPELEEILGICDDDDSEDIESKIEDGIEDERIREPIVQTLFD